MSAAIDKCAAAHEPAGPQSISEAIAEFATTTPGDDLPQSALHVLSLSLLDWFAVANAGRDEPVSRITRDMAAGEGGTAEASVIGLNSKLPARAAAMVNGTTSHALDYDDTHFDYIGHPSVAVLPAALGLAERTGAPGPTFLTAALVGVETACRIGAWLGRGHYDHGFHQTATSGAFGAAMAASRLLGLNSERARHALGLASTRASGLKSQFGTMGKPLNAGIAASNGVEAALLAAAGFVSRPDGLECDQGFCATHAGDRRDLAWALDGLGDRFAFETVQHKYHACCHGLHAALEALIEARSRYTITPEEVEHVAITVNPSWLSVCNIAAPATGLEAKFSYRLTAAMALTGRDTSALETFSEASCHEPGLVRLRDRVSVAGSEKLADTAADVAITRHNGSRVTVSHDFSVLRPADTRQARVRAKAASLLGVSRAADLWQRIHALGQSPAPADWAGLFGA